MHRFERLGAILQARNYRCNNGLCKWIGGKLFNVPTSNTSVTLTAPYPLVTVRLKPFYLRDLAGESRRGPGPDFGGNMKKTGLLLLLLPDRGWQLRSKPIHSGRARRLRTNTQITTGNFPYRAGPDPNQRRPVLRAVRQQTAHAQREFRRGRAGNPDTTKFVTNDKWSTWRVAATRRGSSTTIVRELRDPNEYELFAGQHAMLKAIGQPYAELGRVRIVDTRSKMAIARSRIQLRPIVPGDYRGSLCRKAGDRIPSCPCTSTASCPSNGKASGRIVMAKDFDLRAGHRREDLHECGLQPGSEGRRLPARGAQLRS